MKKALIVITAIVLSVAFLLYNDTIYSAPVGTAPEPQRFVILLDAGHGGVDGGAVAADGTVEKQLNLEIAQQLEPLLVFFGYDVNMTRSTDVSIHDESAITIRQKKNSDLRRRLNMLESSDARLLLSIHQNSFSQSKYSGTQLFYGGNNPDSKQYAAALQSAFKRLLQPDNNRVEKRSTKDIYILHKAAKPAVMVECGFLTNTAERELLKNSEYQQKLCFCIAMGLLQSALQ